MSLLFARKKRARAREGGDSVGTVGAYRAARGMGWVRGRAFSLFCRRPTATSQQAVLSEQVLALPHAFLTAMQLSPHSYIFQFCFKLIFDDGRAGREAG